MPKQSTPDQRNYSVDEMMERLREGEREKRDQPQSELVTRSDGTQVMRVRKRKRRSHQPKAQAAKAAKRQKKSMVVVAAIAIALLLVGAVAMLLQLAKFNSKGYQDGLEARIGQNVDAGVALKGLSVTPLHARAHNMSMGWGEDRMFESLELKKITAPVGIASIVGADWSGEEVTAASGHLKLRQPTQRSVEGPILGEARPFGYHQYQCSFMTIEFGDRKAGGALLKNSEVSFRTHGEGVGQVLLRRGVLDMAGWPPMDIDNGLALVSDGAMELVSLRATPKLGGGEVLFKGVSPIRAGGPVDLAFSLSSFPLADLAGTGMEALVGGVINSTSGSFLLKEGSLRSADIRVEFTGEEAYLKEFPFLDNMRSMFGDTEYAQPVFESVSGIFRRGPNGIELQNLELKQRDQLEVLGTIAVSYEGELSGRLEVGIPEGRAITATGRKRSAILSDPKGGYCWVPVELDGTIKDPGDNFKALLQQAAKEAYQRKGNSSSDKSRFDELTQ